jgi:predicted nucleic acid-binding Zn ribbon protein
MRRGPEPVEIEPDAWFAWCGDPLPEPEERHHGRRYCSEPCKWAMEYDRLRETRQAARPMRACLWCRSSFRAWPSYKFTCTPKCSERYHNRRKRERNAAAQPERPCPICGVPFRPSRAEQAVCGAGCGAAYVWRLRRQRRERAQPAAVRQCSAKA